MGDNRISVWAAPSIGGATNTWGPWQKSGAVITTPNEKSSIGLNFESRADAQSPYNVEIKYRENGVLKTKNEIMGSGDVVVDVGGEENGSMVAIYVRLQSTLTGQEIVMDSGPLEFLPGKPPPDGVEVKDPSGEAIPENVIPKETESNPPLPGHKPPIPGHNYPPLPERKPVAPVIEDGVVPQTDTPRTEASPLVLDLDGNGIELSNVNGAGAVYWDIDEDGIAEASAWIIGGDGLLAIDTNGNGFIDSHSELFGNQNDSPNGFATLAAFDTNNSGTISAEDDQFGDLLVWIDDNQDGYSQTEELYSLTDLKITSINLNYSNSNSQVNGNAIKQISNFTMDGVSHTIVDAWFAYDNVNTVYAQDYTLDIRTLFLPTLRGYGNMPDLHIGMSLDEDLYIKECV